MILSSPQWALSLENPLMLWWQRLPRAMWCSPGSPQSRGVMKESCITLRRWGEHFVWKFFPSSFYENDNNSQFLAFHIICANICTFSAIKLNLFGVFDCWPYKTNNLNMSPCDFTSSHLLSHWHVTADHSVFQGQTPGRGWTLVCQWSLPALPCLTWPRVNPTASVCAAATPLVWARLLYPQKRSRSEINWVRLVHILFGTVYQGIYGWTIWHLQYITIISVLSSCISYILSLCFLHYVLSDSKPLYSLCAPCDQPYFLSFFCIFSTDLPSAPGNPVGIRNTNTSVVVSWGASKDAKHLVGYYIECSQVGTDIWMPCNNKPVKQRRYAQLKIFNSWFINSKSHSLIKRWFDCVVEKKSSLHAHNLEAVRKSEFYTNINCRCPRLNWISANWKCKDGILVEK